MTWKQWVIVVCIFTEVDVLYSLLKKTRVTWWDFWMGILWPISLPVFIISLLLDRMGVDYGMKLSVRYYRYARAEVLGVRNGHCPPNIILKWWDKEVRTCEALWDCKECVAWYSRLPLYKKMYYAYTNAMEKSWKKVRY